MLAFVKASDTPGDAAVREVDVPEPGPGQARVRVAACGICGSDLHALRSDPGFEWLEPPFTFGHELAGVVDAVGEGVEVAVGDRVVPISIQGCLACEDCRTSATQRCPDRKILGLHYDGGLAEQVVVPAAQLVAVPDRVPLVRAAITEPLSVAVRAMTRAAPVLPGDPVVVSGAGPIGLLCARLAQLSGARVCVVGAEPDLDRRLPIAQDWGVATALAGRDDPEELVGGPPRLWVEASGAPAAFAAGLAGLRRGGTMLLLGLFAERVPFFPTDAVRAELTIRCSIGGTHPDYRRALDLLATGAVDPEPLFDRFALADAAEAFAAATAGQAVKPLIVADGSLT